MFYHSGGCPGDQGALAVPEPVVSQVDGRDGGVRLETRAQGLDPHAVVVPPRILREPVAAQIKGQQAGAHLTTATTYVSPHLENSS